MERQTQENISLPMFLKKFTENSVGNLVESPDFGNPEGVTYALINYLTRELCFEDKNGLPPPENGNDVPLIEAWTFSSFLYYRHACNRAYRQMCGFPLDGTQEHKNREKAFDAAIAIGVAHIQQFTGYQIAEHWRERFMEYIDMERRRLAPMATTEHFVFLFYNAQTAVKPAQKYTPNVDWLRRGTRHLGENSEAFVSEFFGPTVFALHRPASCVEMYELACSHYGWDDD